MVRVGALLKLALGYYVFWLPRIHFALDADIMTTHIFYDCHWLSSLVQGYGKKRSDWSQGVMWGRSTHSCNSLKSRSFYWIFTEFLLNIYWNSIEYFLRMSYFILEINFWGLVGTNEYFFLPLRLLNSFSSRDHFLSFQGHSLN